MSLNYIIYLGLIVIVIIIGIIVAFPILCIAVYTLLAIKETPIQTPSFSSEDLLFDIQLDSISYAKARQYSDVSIQCAK